MLGAQARPPARGYPDVVTPTEPARDPSDRAVPVLTVGFVPGVTMTKWRRVWADRFPRLGLEVVELVGSDQLDALMQERVDMCFVRLPVEGPRLHVIPLYEEVPVVVVPKDHPASLFAEVSTADLSEEHLLADVEGVDSFDLVAGGAGVLVVPQSIARSHNRRDLVYRPVSDAPSTRVALAWLQENPHEMIEEFIGIVRGRTANSSRSARTAPAAPGPRDGSTAPARRPGPDTNAGRASAHQRKAAARRPPKRRGR